MGSGGTGSTGEREIERAREREAVDDAALGEYIGEYGERGVDKPLAREGDLLGGETAGCGGNMLVGGSCGDDGRGEGPGDGRAPGNGGASSRVFFPLFLRPKLSERFLRVIPSACQAVNVKNAAHVARKRTCPPMLILRARDELLSHSSLAGAGCRPRCAPLSAREV